MLLSDGLLDPSYFTCEAKNVKFGHNFVAFSETYEFCLHRTECTAAITCAYMYVFRPFAEIICSSGVKIKCKYCEFLPGFDSELTGCRSFALS